MIPKKKSKDILNGFDLDSFYDVDEYGDRIKKQVKRPLKDENLDKFHGSSYYKDHSYTEPRVGSLNRLLKFIFG